MINGCAYCIEMHSDVAMKHGESAQRLLALAAWQESPLFDARERAVLALTDEVTLIADKGLTTQTYEAALAQLGETLLAQCLIRWSPSTPGTGSPWRPGWNTITPDSDSE